MAKKLWEKSYSTDQLIEEFTVGDDTKWDMHLAPFDVLGSLAHTEMLETIGLLEKAELEKIQIELKDIYRLIEKGDFKIEDGVEDIHSQVELELTRRIGDIGKKIHSGRSRNDQVLVDLKLYMRSEIEEIVYTVERFFSLLIEKSNQYKDILIPGYTHLQIAMPSSLGLWFGAYAESLVDDLEMLRGAYRVVNKNPLGSAAGYGSSFPLNRTLTTKLLGFENLNYNVVYAQMSRGKTEKLVSMAMASIASTLARMSMDVCLYMNQNLGFISFPKELTTGSSIMPHKKNPDVFEIIRGKCNIISTLPNEITGLLNNLPSGYHREMQLVKDHFFPVFGQIKDCMQLATVMFENIIVNKDILEDEKYQYLFSVEEVNRLVLKGIPFRDAYKQVGEDIENGNFNTSHLVNHTHEGSIGNLCNDEIRQMMQDVVASFEFHKTKEAIKSLVQ